MRANNADKVNKVNRANKAAKISDANVKKGKDKRKNHGQNQEQDRGQNQGQKLSKQSYYSKYGKQQSADLHMNPQETLIFGYHPVVAALKNPKRIISKIFFTSKSLQKFKQNFHQDFATSPNTTSPYQNNAGGGAEEFLAKYLPHSPHSLQSQQKMGKVIEIVDGNFFHKQFADGVVHQQICCLAKPLVQYVLPQNLWQEKIITIADNVSDPQNLGSIIRSAVAFGCKNIISQKSNSPNETGSLIKATAGNYEIANYIKVTNLNMLIEQLKSNGFWCFGLDGKPENQSITGVDFADYQKIALFVGSEAKGLRKLVKEKLDILIKINIIKEVESLNASVAYGIAMWHISNCIKNGAN